MAATNERTSLLYAIHTLQIKNRTAGSSSPMTGARKLYGPAYAGLSSVKTV